MLAEEYRRKQAERGGLRDGADLIDILTMNTHREEWRREVQTLLAFEEEKECTFKPIIN